MRVKCFLLGLLFLFYSNLGIRSKINAIQVNTKELAEKTRTPNESIPEEALSVGPYRLIDLMVIALKNAPEVKRESIRVKITEAQLKKAKSSFLPKANAGLSGTRLRDQNVVTHTPQHLTILTPSLQITYKLFQWGADKAQVESVVQLLQAANYGYNRTVQKLIFDLQCAYYDFYAASALRIVAKSAWDEWEKITEATETKFSVGLVNLADKLQAKANFLEAQYNCQAAEALIEARRVQLALVLGISVTKELKIESPEPERLPRFSPSKLENYIKEALERRLDLKAEQAVLASQQEKEKSAKGSFWPSVYLEVGMSWDRIKRSHSTKRNHSVGVSLRWDLFDGFSNMAQQMEALEKVKLERENLRRMQLEIRGEIWKAFANYQAEFAKNEAASELERAAQESCDAIRVGYEKGTKHLLDMLTAQKTLENARQKRIQSYAELGKSFAQIIFVLGINYDTISSLN